LGPEAAFLVISSVLTVQALFMADGGLLALGCNVFNLGFFPAFVAYPLFRRIVGDRWTTGRIFGGSIAAAEVGLLLGAFGVVLQTTLSGVSSLPLSYFVAAMIPIHVAIGLVEGLVTAAVVLFVRQAQPELLARNAERKPVAGLNLKPVLVGVALAAVLSGAAFSWFASTHPDGLEWSIAKVSGSEEFAGKASESIHQTLAALQEKTAFLPDYGFKTTAAAPEAEPSWPSPNAGTSVAGAVGAILTLLVAVAVGYGLAGRWRGPSDRKPRS